VQPIDSSPRRNRRNVAQPRGSRLGAAAAAERREEEVASSASSVDARACGELETITGVRREARRDPRSRPEEGAWPAPEDDRQIPDRGRTSHGRRSPRFATGTRPPHAEGVGRTAAGENRWSAPAMESRS